MHLCFARKNDPDLSELARLRIDLDRPRMLLHDDVVSDGQTEARTLTGGFCREEGIEHLFPDLGRNAGAVVANPNFNFVTEVFVAAVRVGSYVSPLLCPLRVAA